MPIQRKAPSPFTSTAAPAYTVEASKRNPSEGAVEIEQFEIARTTAEALGFARSFHRAGFWVEVFRNSDKELIAGPFDPEQPLPKSI